MVESAAPERTAQLMADRYGAPASPRRRRLGLWITAGSLGALGAAALVMIGIGFFEPDAATSDVGFDVQSDATVQVTFDVTKPNAATASCTLEALSVGYGQVGLREMQVGPQDHHTTRITVDIATTERATTGIVRGCRLID